MEEYFTDNSKIIECDEIVGFYEFVIDGVDDKLKVKVVKYDDKRFMGIANLEVKGSSAASFYRSLSMKDTKEQAVRDAVSGFFAFYSSDAEVRKVKDW